jgi:hypothetical protein
MPEQPSGRVEFDPLAPWPTLAERDAGELPSTELYEGVPPHLSPYLSGWVSNTLVNDELARKVLTRLRVSWDPKVTGDRVLGRQVVQWLADGHTSALQFARSVDRLSAVNAIIGLHPWWEDKTRDQANGRTRQERWFAQLVALRACLTWQS